MIYQTPPYKLYPTIKDANISSEFPIMFDTETQGNGFGKTKNRMDFYGEIVLASFYAQDWDEVKLIRFPNLNELIEVLSKHRIVMHNACYDLSTIAYQNNRQCFIPERFDDTMLLTRYDMIDSDSVALDIAVRYYHKRDIYNADIYMKYQEMFDKRNAKLKHKKSVSEIIVEMDWKKPQLHPAQIDYAIADVYYLRKVFTQTQHHRNTEWYKLKKNTIKILLEMQHNGIPVSYDRIHKVLETIENTINDIDCPVNSKSTPQTKAFLGINSNADKFFLLKEIKDNDNKKARQIYDDRKYRTMLSYVEKYIDGVDKDKRLRGFFAPINRTGRVRCDNINLQNIERNLLRDIFTCSNDSVFVYTDFAQLELRCFCAAVGENNMEKYLRDGLDMHGATAKHIFGDNYTKEERFTAKQFNFTALYGAGPNKLRDILVAKSELLLSVDEIARIKHKWLNFWTGIKRYHNDGSNAIRIGDIWSTPLGLRYKTDKYNEMLNLQIQGFASEITDYSLFLIMRDIDKTKVKLINYVHDCFLFECNDMSYLEELSKLIQHSMVDSWQTICKNVKIKDLPLPVEIKIGKNWGDIESGKEVMKSYEF